MTRAPRTFVGSVRCDARTLATLHEHFAAQGIECKNISDLIRAGLELTRLVVKAKGAVREFSTSEAISYLANFGISSYGTRGKRNLVDQLRAEEYALPDNAPYIPSGSIDLEALVRAIAQPGRVEAPPLGETNGIAEATAEVKTCETDPAEH